MSNAATGLGKSRTGKIILWVIAVIATVLCFTYQDQTGPTYPLEGDLSVEGGTVHFKFLRSETIGTDLAVMLEDPVPEGVTGYVEYRRFSSDDDWSVTPMERQTFRFSRRSVVSEVEGVGATLPSLGERAGKYEYYVYIDDGSGTAVSVTGDVPILARYKGFVPRGVLVIHILVVFASMALAIRAVLEAAVDGSYRWMIWATIVSLLLGAFVLGPAVQWYAFGVLWAGIPFGWDWTDNKVLLELVFWMAAAYTNRGDRRDRRAVYLAGVVTLLAYFIPHSVFGSEYDYRTGAGRGTVG
jgi:hypothetical protein